jgi:hypothetical protein
VASCQALCAWVRICLKAEAVSRCRRGRNWLDTALSGPKKRCACSADLKRCRWLALARWQVRVFSPIVQPFVAPMLGVRQHLSNGWRVACELVRDHHPRLCAALAVKHSTQEALGSCLIAPLLNQDVQHDSVLIKGSPQPMALAADLQRNLVHMPFVAGAYPSAAQHGREGGAELGAPLSDRLVADDEAALGEQVLHVTEAEVEAKVQPHVLDDLRREAVAAIR